jgi:hypothetical protein
MRSRRSQATCVTACGRLRALREDEEFSLAYERRHFRDYHLLLDEQATQIFAMSDTIAERARKIGGTTWTLAVAPQEGSLLESMVTK